MFETKKITGKIVNHNTSIIGNLYFLASFKKPVCVLTFLLKNKTSSPEESF